MKLLYCGKCNHIFSLGYDLRSCSCGRVKGRYINNSQAIVNGEGYSLGVNNFDLIEKDMKLYRIKKELRNNSLEDPKTIARELGRIELWIREHEGETNPNTLVTHNPLKLEKITQQEYNTLMEVRDKLRKIKEEKDS